jgi:flavin-binding protein dodecin
VLRSRPGASEAALNQILVVEEGRITEYQVNMMVTFVLDD